MNRSTLRTVTFGLLAFGIFGAAISNCACLWSQEADSVNMRKELEAKQKQLAVQYKKVEELFIRMAELEGASNPTRAALLMRAAEESKQHATRQRMADAGDFLSKGQLSRALQEQEASRENLKKLLELLQSENRSSRLRDERKRLEDVLKDIRRIENIQRATRGRVEAGEDKERAANDQGDLEKQLQQASSDLKTDDTQSDKENDPSKDKTESNQQKSNDLKGETPTDPKSNPSADGKTEQPSGTNPPEDKPSQGKESQGKESQDQPKQGKPNDGKQSEDKQAKDDDSEEKDGSESESESSPSDGDKKPPSKEEQAKKRVEKARKNMKRAEDRLRKDKRKEAVEEQNKAERELQAAIVELERILRQLREEEVERSLVDLESRLKKMYEMEKTIRDQTDRLAQLTGEAKDRQLEIGANKLSLEQTKVLMEGQRALLLLHDEGTSQAFPEALEQVNRDAQTASRRLAAADVSSATQAIEDEILGALEEMLDSVKQVQKQREDQKQQQGGQQQSGDDKDQPLVDKLAELKLIKTLQLRVNRRTDRLSQETNNTGDLVGQVSDPRQREELSELSARQKKIQQVTREIIIILENPPK